MSNTKEEIIRKHLNVEYKDGKHFAEFTYPAAMDEYARQEAIAFAEWIYKEDYNRTGDKVWYKWLGLDYSGVPLTTDELYTLYTQNKNQ